MQPAQPDGTTASTDRIRELNDAFRKTLRGGRATMTSGVDDLPDCVKAEALVQVAHFWDFTADNDPHGEHDFGSFTLVGRKFFGRSTITTSAASSVPKIPVIRRRRPAC